MKSRFLLILTIPIVLALVFGVLARDKKYYELEQQPKPSVPFQLNSQQDVLLNWPLLSGVQQTGEIIAGFNCFGMFSGDYTLNPNIPPYAFATPADAPVDYLYAGDMWVGGIVGDDTLVSVGYGGWSFTREFLTPLDYYLNLTPTVTNPDYIADKTLRAEFTDTIVVAWPIPIQQADPIDGLHRPLNLKVAVRSHAWYSSPENGAIIYDVVITNIGNEPISSCYYGCYFDFDIGGIDYFSALDDLAGSLKEYGIGYGIDNNGDLNDSLQPTPAAKIFAFKYLDNSFKASDTNFNWWAARWIDSVDFGPRQNGTPSHPFRDFGTGGTGIPAGDANKYYLMSFDEWDYDQIYTNSIGNSDPVWMEPPSVLALEISYGFDSRFLMSLGPFELMPDSSVRILFTTFTGDFVVTTGDAINYLPDLPEIYYSLLYFDDVITNAGIADSLAQLLLNPNLPPLGLQLALRQDNTTELQWDPWVYEEVDGYELFISEAYLDTLPYPGIIPPWWGPGLTQATASMGRTHRLPIDSLDHDTHYLASIAHRIGTELGEFSPPINFKINPRTAAPEIPTRYAFANPGGPLALHWNNPDKENIDHYNIYKFSDSASSSEAYHAVYDEGYRAQFIQLLDSFFIGSKTFYYYAMEPYAVVGGNDTVYYDNNASEGEVYLITSSDEHGFESEFTKLIYANEVDEMNRDILLVTNSPVVTSVNYTYVDSILSFYNQVLQGYDFEIYNYRDSTGSVICPAQTSDCIDWHDFMSFKMVIIDDRLSEGMFAIPIDEVAEHFIRYLGYGGKLVLFTRFRNYGLINPDGFLNYFRIRNNFINDYLGVDSLMFGGEKYYYNNCSPPYVDTLFGFTAAISTDSFLQDVYLDLNRDPYRSRLRNYWTPTTPPGVATFKLMNNAVPVQTFSSAYPDISLQQDHIVGLKKEFPDLNTSSYVFGYHLWNMDAADARDLIETLLGAAPSALAAQTSLSPSVFNIVEANSIEPRYASVYVGNIVQGHSASEIDIGSLTINSTIAPTSSQILSSRPSYTGEVLQLEVPLRQFLLSYSPVWDTLHTSYSISGLLTGNEPFQASGAVTIIGRNRGDFNQDSQVNITDLNLIVGYLFRGQGLPPEFDVELMDADGAVNILDLTYLVNYIFRSGANY